MDAEFYIMIRTNNFSNLLQKVVSKDQKFALKCKNLVECIDTNILIPGANKCRVFTNICLIIQITCINTFHQLVNSWIQNLDIVLTIEGQSFNPGSN